MKAIDKMVEWLEEWQSDYKKGPCSDVAHCLRKAKILALEEAKENPRHEAEQGEGLREQISARLKGAKTSIREIEKVGETPYWWYGVKSVCEELLSLNTTPTKPTEPLAVLADRKGIRRFQYDVYGDNTWSIYLNKDEENGHWVEKEFYAPTYALAEAKARAYLMALEDKEGV